MHNSIKIDFEGIALENGGTLVKDVPYVVGLKNYHFILSNLSLGGVIQNDISVEAIVTLESVIENEGQEDEFTSYHQQIVFKNVYGYDVTIYDKAVTCSDVPSGQDVLDAIADGTLENAKPIYFHPITLDNDEDYVLSFIILNNSPEPIDTWDKIKSWAASLEASVVRIPVTGFYKSATKNVIASFLFYSGNTMYLLGYDTIGGDVTRPAVNIDGITPAYVTDGVNKIN